MTEYGIPQPPAGIQPPPLKLKRIQVFGILHIVFGALGLMSSVFNLASLLFLEKSLEWTTRGQPPELVDLQRRMNNEMIPTTIVGGVIGLILSVLILRAGIQLVRCRRSCLKANLQYAWTSIAMKVVMLGVYAFWVNPILNRLFDGFAEALGPNPSQEMELMFATIKISALVAGLLAPILGMIYPALALGLLNRREVKAFVAQHGT